jgi:hypothetical protein
VTLMAAFCSWVWPLPPPGPESLAAIRFGSPSGPARDAASDA